MEQRIAIDDFAYSVRMCQQAAVADLGQRALTGADLSTLLNDAVALVAQTLDVEYCKVLELLPDGATLLLRAGVGWQDGLVGHATVEIEPHSQVDYILRSSAPVIVENLPAETRCRALPLLRDHGVISGISGVIINGQDRPFGVLGAYTTGRRTFTVDDVNFLQAVANTLAMAVVRKRAEDRLREYAARAEAECRTANERLQHELDERQRVEVELAEIRRRLAESREAERLFLARELHDSAVQQLIGISYQLAEGRRRASSRQRSPTQRLAELAATLSAGQQEVLGVARQLRRLIGELRPAGLAEFGLTTALEGYVAHLEREGGSKLPAIELALARDGTDLPQLVGICLFRVAQEALRNAIKHAQARRIELSFRQLDDEALLSVRDDGGGFQAPARLSELARDEHFGLIGMAEWVAGVGGQLTIRSQPGMGTDVTIRVRLTSPEEPGG